MGEASCGPRGLPGQHWQEPSWGPGFSPGPTVAAAPARWASGPRARPFTISCKLVRKPEPGEALSRRRAAPLLGTPSTQPCPSDPRPLSLASPVHPPWASVAPSLGNQGFLNASFWSTAASQS